MSIAEHRNNGTLNPSTLRHGINAFAAELCGSSSLCALKDLVFHTGVNNGTITITTTKRLGTLCTLLEFPVKKHRPSPPNPFPSCQFRRYRFNSHTCAKIRFGLFTRGNRVCVCVVVEILHWQRVTVAMETDVRCHTDEYIRRYILHRGKMFSVVNHIFMRPGSSGAYPWHQSNFP